MHRAFSFIQKACIIALALLLSAVGATGAQAGHALAPNGYIQDLINAAPDYGTINIPAGTYSETLTIDKNLTLVGAGSTLTTLQPAASGQRVITVTAGHNLSLENMTVTGGNLASGVGGGVLVEGSSLSLDTCIFSLNSANSGGAVYQAGNGMVTASQSQFNSNTANATDGGGLFAEGSASVFYSIFSDNMANRHGGAVYVYQGDAHLIGGQFINNHANSGNGGAIDLNNGLLINGTEFTVNTAGDQGGAVSQWNAGQTISILSATFSNNEAKNKGGGACLNSYLTMSGTTFDNNWVTTGDSSNAYGGGVYAGGGLEGNLLTFTNNLADCIGCGYTAGGGIFITRPVAGPSSITNSTFEGNLAWLGSGIDSSMQVQLTITGSTFRNNGDPFKAGYGGGISANQVNGDRLLFQGNRTLNAGGGIDAFSATLTRSRFIDNSSSAAGGGGAIRAHAAITGTNLLFDSNTSDYGAAIKIMYGPAVLRHITISQPSQGSGPAILINSTGSAELYNSLLTNYNPGVKLEGTLTEDYNMFYNNLNDISLGSAGSYNPGGHSTGMIDPRFVSPTQGDYHLRPCSYTIGHGTNLGIATDLDGIPRQNRWDIGAYQFDSIFYCGVFLPLVHK